MQIILSDHNCEGQAEELFNVLEYDGDWLKLVPMELRWFRDVGLSDKAKDETLRSVAFLSRTQLYLANWE